MSSIVDRLRFLRRNMDKTEALRSSNIAMDDFSMPLIRKKKFERYCKKRRIRRQLLNIAAPSVIVMLLLLVLALAFHFRRSEHNTVYYPMAETECGPVQGIAENVGNSSGFVFKGIPFAMPPVGSRRWKPPESMKSDFCWKGILKADTFRAPCCQLNQEKETGSEDCLYIDVWTPKVKTEQKLPVMVLIPGVDLKIDSSHMPNYVPNVEFVESLNIVAVRINYRRNVFGFLALDVLSKYSNSNTSGNYGMMDQIMALGWIQRNIHVFGGDPSKVTVVGHGSGATSVFGLLASKKAGGLFSQAMAMSGIAVLSKTVKAASTDNEIFLKRSKCKKNNDEETLQCLYKLNASEILHSVPWLMYPNWGMTELNDLPQKGVFSAALSVVDGEILTIAPEELKTTLAMPHNVTLMIGTTAQEIAFQPAHNFTGKSFGELKKFVEERLKPLSVDLPKRAINLYKTLLNSNDPQLIYTTMATDIKATCPIDGISLNFSTVDNLNVYRYTIKNRPGRPARFAAKPTAYSAHFWDLSALFGFSGMPFGYNPTKRDLQFRDTIRKVFLQFFKTGKPGVTEWSTYPSRVGIFGDERLTVEGNIHRAICELWNENNIFKCSR